MSRFTIIAIATATTVCFALAYLLFTTDSHQGGFTAVTFQTGGVEFGDPDEPTAAESIRCASPPSIGMYNGWPFAVSRGSSRCAQDDTRLLLYPIGITLNIVIAGTAGVITYLMLKLIRRRT